MNSQTIKETLIISEIAPVENKRSYELLRRYNMHERDSTLRDIRKKFEAVYISCYLKQQMLNSKYKRLQERSNEIKKSLLLNNTRLKETMEAAEEREKEIEHVMAYNRDLMKQKIDKVEQNKREHYEENMKDKKMMDDIMNKIVEEDLESMKHKLEMKEKMRCEMVECQEQRKMLKEEQKLFATQEDLRLREEDRETIDWDAIAFAQRAEKFEKRERSNERIMGEIQEKKADAQRRGDLVNLLQEQERVEKNMQDEIFRNEKLEQTKREIKDVLMWQMQSKADVAAAERVWDAEFVHMAQQQMLKDDEEERDKELKKKDEQKKYAQALKEQILENASRRKRDLEERN